MPGVAVQRVSVRLSVASYWRTLAGRMGALDSATAALAYGPICVLKGSVLAAIE